MEAATLNRISIAEYITISKEQNQKYEYHDGSIFAMAGGTLEHGTIGGNIFSFLNERSGTDGSKCRTFNSDIRLHVEKSNKIFYPDVMIVCNQIERSKAEKESIINPTVIVEVLSETTESYDRGDKFHFYQQIPSLKEYVLVAQDKQQVDIFKREGENTWKIRRYQAEDKVLHLESIEVEIPFDMIYRNVAFN